MNWRLGVSRLWIVVAVLWAVFVSILKYESFSEYVMVWAVVALPLLGILYGIVWIVDGFNSSSDP